MPNKPIIAVDFDGVIHSYTSGWQGADVISDPPVQGAFEWISKAVMVYKVHIVSSRFRHISGVSAVEEWMVEHGMPRDVLRALVLDRERPPALVTLDDRAMTFDGTFPSFEEIQAFRPWYRR